MAIKDDLAQTRERSNQRRTATAAVIGSVVEYYDFTLFGLAAALVFGPLFFPDASPEAQVVSALLAFAVGYIGRPIGGLIFSHFGDRIGRKPMLVATLILMGVSTIAIGCLPTFAQIGVWAPILLGLCRFLQGMGAGAEYVGSIVMLAETGGRKSFGLRVALPGMGVFAGIVLATAVFQIVAALPEEQMLSWGWRVPFFAAALTLVVGLYIRSQITETEQFQLQRNSAEGVARFPLLDVLRSHWREVLIGLGLNGPYILFSSILQVFLLSYLINTLKLAPSVGIAANFIASALAIATTPFFGWLGDRVGRLQVWAIGLTTMGIFGATVFGVFGSRNPAAIVAIMVLGISIALAALYATQGALLTALFPTQQRLTGVVLIRESTAAAIGGPSPAVAAQLVAVAASPAPAIGLLLGGVAIAGTTTVLARNRLRRGIDEVATGSAAPDGT